MESENHLKKWMYQKNLMKTGFLLIASVLLPLLLSAQITISSSPPPKEEKPKWEHMRESIMMPYDSLYFQISYYPIFDAYKKYIGQRLFIFGDAKEGYLFGTDRVTMFTQNLKNPTCDQVEGKYFEIIDVISIPEFESSIINPDRLDYQTYNKAYNSLFSFKGRIRSDGSWWDYPDGTSKIENENIPVFKVREINSMETFYMCVIPLTTFDEVYNPKERYILVGGYVKFKEKMVGKNIVHYKYNSESIKSIWKCIDVSISQDSKLFFKPDALSSVYGLFNDEKQLVLVLQDTQDQSTITHLRYGILETDMPIKQSGMALENIFQDYLLRAADRKKQTEQEIKQRAEAYKQQLITKYGAAAAAKIMAGKLEIGMSKDVCKAIMESSFRNISIIDKTTSTETWRCSYRNDSESYILYFTNDKLARISYR